MALLEIRNLSVDFPTIRGKFRAVDQLDLAVDHGEIVGIVGESGSGKSVSMLAMMGLIPWPGEVSADSMCFNGTEILHLSSKERRKITGKDIAMIFQEPMTSLNPCFTVGFQIAEMIKTHEGGSRRALRERTIELLDLVGIPAPRTRLDAYPYQLSGGMSQRVMIAMAIACNPKLLIADEPTTALDVTIQAQILDLLCKLQEETKMALILITHDMGVVAETCQRVVVMYAGQQMEAQPAEDIFIKPRHPYTAALLRSLPEYSGDAKRLNSIPGTVPGAYDRPSGCLFNPRCSLSHERCRLEQPLLRGQDGRLVRCHTPLDKEADFAA